MTDWDAWSRIVDAAQDPQHREAVQRFLAQADLSADIPAAIDERFLAPRRQAGATKVQCAYVLCNLGFAALVRGTRETAAFAMACGRVANELAPDEPDVTLRRLFLSTKGALVVAVLTNQPHVLWDDAAKRCAAYFDAIDQYLETLPTDSVAGNAMAAYSFAGKTLSRVAAFRAAAYYAGEVASLVFRAVRLERRLPAALVSRVWSTAMPGLDAGAFFREIGAEAERALQVAGESTPSAGKGLDTIDEILSRTDESGSRRPRLERVRAELLLASGRDADALEMAKTLQNSTDASTRFGARLIEARLRLMAGNPHAAMEILSLSSKKAPSAEQAVEAWCANWTGDEDDGHWTHRSDAHPRLEDIREAWAIEAMAAAELNDLPGCLGAVDRFGGFLADSFLHDRQRWAARLRRSDGERSTSSDKTAAWRDVPAGDPPVLLDEIFNAIGEGTALLQVARTDAGMLITTTRRRNGDMLFSPAPVRREATGLQSSHKAWSRAHFDAYRASSGGSDREADCAAAFAGLLDETEKVFGELLQELLQEGVGQLILIGDDFVDIPLHAARTGDGDQRLIDRMPVTYVPSLSVLRTCLSRASVNTSERKGIGLHCLVDGRLHGADVRALSTVLDTEATDAIPDVGGLPGENVAACRVLHVVAQLDHSALKPFDSELRIGDHDFFLSDVVSTLDLPECEIVSGFACESALPSMLRAPCLDLSTIFLAAGARVVLASTWETEAELASEMTRAFFGYWVAGESPSTAFRLALSDLRAGQSPLADFRWAGMRLVGAP